MPTITIKTDRCTSNYDALEVVGKYMLYNYSERKYLKERIINAKSGRKLKVKNLKNKRGMNVCNIMFNVKYIETMRINI